MALSTVPVLVGDESKSKIKDIEPLLKWGAVAYGAGFLTVMAHTYRLGVPVLELVEPVYMWIGWPLALVLYFLKQLYGYYRHTRQTLRMELDEIDRTFQTLQTISSPQQAAQILVSLFKAAVALFTFLVPFGHILELFFARPLFLVWQRMLNLHLGNPNNVAILVRYAQSGARILRVAHAVAAFYRFAGRLLLLAAVPAACFAYIYWVYPAVPQSLGGGRPSQVRLMVDSTKIPVGDPALASLFPPLASASAQGAESAPHDSKARTTCPLLLHYRTEKAYYVKRGNGPVVIIGDGAVEGIIFQAGHSQGCN